jgi:transposase-like protein
MSKTSTTRIFSREFKLSAVRRMLVGENVSALARELLVLRKDLYLWRDRFRAGGPEALRSPGRPRKVPLTDPVAPSQPPPDRPPDAAAAELASARRRISELEAKIGRQALELDFFQRALRQVGEVRRGKDKPGAMPSTPSSKR